MKHPLAIFFLFLCGESLRADDILPQRPDFARYAPMLKRSPFAVATAVVAPAATPDFARDLYIANAAKSPNGDLVTIASSTDRNFKEYLTTRDAVDGYRVTNIDWSDRVGGTKVTITKDGKYATLTFNQALLTQPAMGNAPQAQLQLPVQPPNNPLAPATAAAPPAYLKPAPIPSVPPQPIIPPGSQVSPQIAPGIPQNAIQNRIRSRGLIQRNPSVPIPTPITPPQPPSPDADEEE